MPDPYSVLFLCSNDGSRSILAKALLNEKGRDRFRAYSGAKNPSSGSRQELIAELNAAGITTESLTRTDRDTLLEDRDTPDFDFVIVLCDTSSGEVCTSAHDHPVTANWDIADPAATKGGSNEVKHSFHEAFTLIDRRINLLLALQDSELQRMAMEQRQRRSKAA
jgi:arsenate reductase